jgi:osmotically-inducible protein OsmY
MKMQMFRNAVVTAVAGVALTVAGCSSTPKVADVRDSIRGSLVQAGLKDVSVNQDRDKGVVTLGGHVTSDADKAQAESIAQSSALGQVVANQIAVLPPGAESTAKDINSDLDKGIEKNIDAALLQSAVHDDLKDVKYAVKSGVVTLTGEVNSQRRRVGVQEIAAAVPNVQQVVNELEVKKQRATSTP